MIELLTAVWLCAMLIMLVGLARIYTKAIRHARLAKAEMQDAAVLMDELAEDKVFLNEQKDLHREQATEVKKAMDYEMARIVEERMHLEEDAEYAQQQLAKEVAVWTATQCSEEVPVTSSTCVAEAYQKSMLADRSMHLSFGSSRWGLAEPPKPKCCNGTESCGNPREVGSLCIECFKDFSG